MTRSLFVFVLAALYVSQSSAAPAGSASSSVTSASAADDLPKASGGAASASASGSLAGGPSKSLGLSSAAFPSSSSTKDVPEDCLQYINDAAGFPGLSSGAARPSFTPKVSGGAYGPGASSLPAGGPGASASLGEDVSKSISAPKGGETPKAPLNGRAEPSSAAAGASASESGGALESGGASLPGHLRPSASGSGLGGGPKASGSGFSKAPKASASGTTSVDPRIPASCLPFIPGRGSASGSGAPPHRPTDSASAGKGGAGFGGPSASGASSAALGGASSAAGGASSKVAGGVASSKAAGASATPDLD